MHYTRKQSVHFGRNVENNVRDELRIYCANDKDSLAISDGGAICH